MCNRRAWKAGHERRPMRRQHEDVYAVRGRAQYLSERLARMHPVAVRDA